MNKSILLFVLIVSFLNGCSQQTAATQKLDEKAVQVGIMAMIWPKTVTSNTDFIVNTKIINAGDVTLPALGKDGDLLRVGISYHWRSMDDKVVIWDGLVTFLKSDLKKNEEKKVDIAVKSPPNPGKYILEIDLVQNSAFWFNGYGSQTARMVIDVK
jgi:hypothetical protein